MGGRSSSSLSCRLQDGRSQEPNPACQVRTTTSFIATVATSVIRSAGHRLTNIASRAALRVLPDRQPSLAVLSVNSLSYASVVKMRVCWFLRSLLRLYVSLSVCVCVFVCMCLFACVRVCVCVGWVVPALFCSSTR